MVAMFRLAMAGVSHDAAAIGRELIRFTSEGPSSSPDFPSSNMVSTTSRESERSNSFSSPCSSQSKLTGAVTKRTMLLCRCDSWSTTAGSVAPDSFGLEAARSRSLSWSSVSSEDSTSTVHSSSTLPSTESVESLGFQADATRRTFPPEERLKHAKVVRLPEFQDWARKAVFFQREISMPTLLTDIMSDQAPLPAPEAQLPSTKEALRRPRSQRRLSVETPVIGRRDSEGVLVGFMHSDERYARRSSPFYEHDRGCESTISAMVGEDAMQEAIVKRANGTVMKLFLKSVGKRSMIRKSTETPQSPPSPTSATGSESGSFLVGSQPSLAFAQRTAIGAEANVFDMVYSDVRNVIEERISFRPLLRRHTIC